MNQNEKILYGKNEEENIVAVESIYGKNIVQIFKRVDGELETRFEEFDLFFFCNEEDSLLEDTRGCKVQKLLGDNPLNRLVFTDNTGIHFSKKKQTYNREESVARPKFPFMESQYLIQTGKTLFNGMDEQDPLILYFDLEVITKDGYEFPNASRQEDEIVIIAMRTNRGDEWVLHTDEDLDDSDLLVSCLNEKDLIEKFVELFLQIDPDIIANHNIFNFDLPYLRKRAQIHEVKLALGRNGSEPRFYTTNIKFADREREYENYDIYGRQVIDTQFLAEYRDVVARNMPSYGLKDLVKYLDKAEKDRTYIDGAELSDVWKGRSDEHTREDMIKYAVEDVREAEILYKEWSGAFFEMSTIVPMNYQEVFRYGTGNQVEYVFMREYFDQRWSYPVSSPHEHISGGYADVLKYGMVKGRIMYADVASLYPSLGKILEISPKKDELGIYQKILNELTDIKMNINKKEEGSKYGAIKIFLNTMSYGFIAFGMSSFNDYGEAQRITETGQEVIKQMNSLVRQDGGFPIKVDTDGTALRVPEDWVGKEDEYVDHLTERLRDGIVIDNDGVYDGIISFDKKSYALLETDGSVKIKGNTLIGRSIEGFFTNLIERCIKALFSGEDQACQDMYEELKKRLHARNMEASEVAKRRNINMRLEEYANKNKSGNTQTLAQYELAIKANRPYQKGDVIRYYIKEYPYIRKTIYGKPEIRKKKCKNYEAAELIENYDYDYEIDYYLDRLDTAARKFMILGKEKFEELFDVKVYAKDRKKYKKLTGMDYEHENT